MGRCGDQAWGLAQKLLTWFLLSRAAVRGVDRYIGSLSLN